MAKKRSRKSSKCPEPFNTLIDLAGAAALDYIAYKRRQKCGYKKTKIDPYAAAGVAFGLGKLESTEDILELGGMLGAMGAFDSDEEDSDLGEQYGVYRDDYATRDEYVEALNNARFDVSDDEEDEDDIDFDDSDLCVIYRVSRLDNGDNRDYQSDDDSLRPGDQVLVPDGNGGSVVGIVIAVKTPSIEEIGLETEIPKIIGKV
ncbi:MAG: hypothetical protein Q4E72_07015 [bacterium]|nr:hypothetical protein [bacterium]